MSFIQPTQVPPEYKDVYVHEGRDAKLVWIYSVTSRDELDQIWAVRWETFIPKFDRSNSASRRGMINEKRDGTRQNVGTTPSYLTGRISIEDPATLVIRNVKTTDDNFYLCKLGTSDIINPGAISLIKLTVISKLCSYFHCAINALITHTD